MALDESIRSAAGGLVAPAGEAYAAVMPASIRLSKRVVDLTGCSRSQADRYIEDGWVRVDGVTVEEPQFPVEDQTVELDPGARLVATEPATIAWHKPAGTSVEQALADPRTVFAPEQRSELDRSGVRTLRRHLAHLVAVLPLETEASGLCVFSQDARVQRHLSEAARKLEQELVVEVSGVIRRGGLEQLAAGLSFEGRELARAKASFQSEDKLRLALKAVRPGEVVALCEAVGLRALQTKRLRVGRVGLAKMPVGTWRYLSVEERF